MNSSILQTDSSSFRSSTKLPNFLIIGAAKSGTSSLWDYLRQHPDIYMPINKEPNFFAFQGKTPDFHGPDDDARIFAKLYQYSITEFEDYADLFKDAAQESAIGEASVRYLYFPDSASRIQQYLPNVKLIVMLRNPIERLYSHYCMNVGMYGLEPLSLRQALTEETNRKNARWGWDWHYVSIGRYYEQLKRYYTRFPANQIRVFLYEDFCQNTLTVVKEIYDYLGVNSSFAPNISTHSKKAYIPKNRQLHHFLTEPNRPRDWLEQLLTPDTYQGLIDLLIQANTKAIPPIESDLKLMLQDTLREDIEQLQTLIGQDLSHWLVS